MAAICNPELVNTHLGLERMCQHSCGTVLPAIYVITAQERLGMDPPFSAWARSEPCSYVSKAGS